MNIKEIVFIHSKIEHKRQGENCYSLKIYFGAEPIKVDVDKETYDSFSAGDILDVTLTRGGSL